jgi:hypothetical protein
LTSRSRFPRYRGRRDPFSYFVFPDSFSAVLRATGPIFDSTEVVVTRFLFLRSRTYFRRQREWRVPFSCFAISDSFSVVPGAMCPVFLFYAPALVFGGTEDVGSRFHILCSLTHFRWYRGRQVPFSCVELPDSFSAVPTASGPVCMFCAPSLVFGGIEGDGCQTVKFNN